MSGNIYPFQIFSIYSINNKVNNHDYIGFTSQQPPELRYKDHLKKSRILIDRPLYRAIKKYGKENFLFKLIYQTKDLKHALEMEQYFIKLYDTHVNNGHGYNLTEGGEGTIGHKHKEETKIKLSKLNIGKTLSDETKMKIIKSTTGEKNHFYGKHHSYESKLKMSNKAKTRTGNKNSFYGKKHSNETKKLLALNNFGKKLSVETKLKLSKTYKILTPSKDEIIIKNLSQFSRDHNLSRECLNQTTNKPKRYHKGFKILEVIA